MKPIYEIARQLANARKESGLTIDDLADKSGYSINFLKHLECGKSTPSFGALTAWAQSLGYEVTIKKKA